MKKQEIRLLHHKQRMKGNSITIPQPLNSYQMLSNYFKYIREHCMTILNTPSSKNPYLIHSMTDWPLAFDCDI